MPSATLSASPLETGPSETGPSETGPLVSVIVPSYNAQETIIETVSSVFQQTLTDFELIVVNDGSTDATLCQLQAIDDPRLKIISIKNGGVANARNVGIEKATGDYLTFLDADDLWTSDKLEKQVAALQQQPKAGVAYSWTRSMNNSGELFYDANACSFSGDVLARLLLENFIVSGSNIMVTRQAVASVGTFDASCNPCEDWDYVLRLARHWDFAVVPQPQVLYRQTTGSMSNNLKKMELACKKVCDRGLSYISENRIQDTIKLSKSQLENRCKSRIYQYLTQISLKNLQDRQTLNGAIQKLSKCIQLWPGILKESKTQRLLVKLLLLSLAPASGKKLLTRVTLKRGSKYIEAQ
ncbi:MAG: glycosyltransferase family 2 protein [Cyanobacteria bacterium J06555_13]